MLSDTSDQNSPKFLTGAQAWRPEVIGTNLRWQYHFTEYDIAELDWATQQWERAVASNSITLMDSYLVGGCLDQKFQRIASELEQGCGFVRIRGLPIERWSRTTLEQIWQALSRMIGQPVYQNHHGQLLREIRAESGDVGNRYGQLPAGESTFLSSRARTASNAALRFHTDRCDIVGLLCTGQAKSGGLSLLASSVTVHNEMLRRFPDLCAELYQDLPRSRIGEEQGGESDWYYLPVWGIRDNQFTSHYSRTYVEALQHVPNAPQISDEQWQAMDKLAELAAEKSLQMHLQPGDIQFINNHVIYHARSEFEDDTVNDQVRCLLRVWLTAPHRALPASHKILWREVESGLPRGGIGQSVVNEPV